MHKNFYASGFLLHPASGRILLQALPLDSSFSWALFTTENVGQEEPIQTFQRLVIDTLEITISQKEIFSVLDYFDEEKNAYHYVFYGVLNDSFDPESDSDGTCGWLLFKQLTKASIPLRDKQNIVVAQRVINAEMRKNMPTTPDK